MSIQNLVRSHILKLQPYASARSEFKSTAKIYLDANENPNKVLKYNRYPDPLQWQLKEAIAEQKKIHPKNIFCGNGSDEAIDILLRLFCKPGVDHIITMPPTYGIYKVYAAIANIKNIEVPLTKNFRLDVNAVIAEANKFSKILFINTPNNPTGNAFASKDVLHLIENFKGIVVVDEAYIDFAKSKSMVTQLQKFENLIVLQTFSKAYGLAGLRIGTAYASEFIIKLMNKIKSPYNINTYTQEMTLKALQKLTIKDHHIAKIISERENMTTELEKISCVKRVFPSDSNYLLVQFLNAELTYRILIKAGIVVRNRSKEMHCENCLRITIGTTQENKMLLNTLKKIT